MTKERNDQPTGQEVLVCRDRYLRHILNVGIPDIQFTSFSRVGADEAVTFSGPFYLANIGSDTQPMLLELRLVPTDLGFGIALLMTNERTPYDLEMMGRRLYERIQERGIVADAVAAPASLGSFLAHEVARRMGPHTPVLTLQKGKATLDDQDKLVVGPPKPWIDEQSGVLVESGTSNQGVQQKLYLDPVITRMFVERGYRTILIDDARLTSGTVSSSLALLKEKGIAVSGIATVLNEAEITTQVRGIPYEFLTKLPIFDMVEDGWQPRPGSYEGLNYFYLPPQ